MVAIETMLAMMAMATTISKSRVELIIAIKIYSYFLQKYMQLETNKLMKLM